MTAPRMRPADLAMALFATSVWAGAFIVTEAALRDTPPLLFAAMRFVVSALFVLVVPFPRVGWRTILALGLVIGVGQHVGIFFGMAHGVPPGVAALLAHTQSFFTLALAWGLLGERLTPRKLVGFGFALAGLLLLMLERGSPMPVAAIAMVMSGSLAGGIGNYILRRAGGADPVGVAAWMAAVAAPLLLALSLAAPLVAAFADLRGDLLLASCYSGILSGLLSYAIWARLFGRYEAHQVAPFMLLVPVGAIALSALILGERMGPWRAAAAAAIVLGLALNVLPARQRR
jgi:O-acetylserine/cysteine efflux transporter